MAEVNKTAMIGVEESKAVISMHTTISQSPPIEYYYVPVFGPTTPQEYADFAIDQVMKLSGCSLRKAVRALRLKQGDTVDAIFYVQRIK